MKFAIVVLAVVAAASAQTVRPGQYNPGQYNPFNYNQQYNRYNKYNPYDPFQKNQYQYNQYNRYSTPSPFRPFVTSTTAAPFVPFAPSTVAPVPAPVPVAVAKVANYDSRNANIVKFGNEINPDGSYNYFYETENGIAAQETGVPRNLGGNPPVVPDVAQGSFSYTSPEGIPVAISYIADENGFQPSGNVLPTPPPLPAQIARALEYIARNAPQK